MNKPIIADNKPIKVELKKGEEYHFCVCGRSANQPFCDGSHAGTDFKPRAFTADDDAEAHLCRCKHSRNQPFCDGTHQQFSDEQVGQEGPGVSDDSSSLPLARPTAEEPSVAFIHELAADGLSKLGHHGPMTAMGVPRNQLPQWDDLQVMVAQMASKPLAEDVETADA
jgi:CDGSH-type Zn-finger protein